ncbi:hypothetical protein [Flavobacterium sp. WC2429]|uniref:DUF1189 domain-containing protein n=1 Tax=Flavobacterium sp. WC2429 TaxID=3234140 RepID=A0AB39WHR0_9FLAO
MDITEILFKIYKDITDSEKTFVKKFYIYLMIAVSLYVTDNIIGFSYFQSVSNKLEKTKEINLILKDSCELSTDELTTLKLLRTDIINHKNIKDNLYSFFSNISFTSSKNPITTKPIETKPIIERDLNVHFYTSASSILLLMIGMFFAGLADKNSSLIIKFFVILFLELLLYPFAYLFSKLLFLIPVINNTPLLNYILNVFLSFLIPFILYYIPTKLNNRNK